MIKNSIVATIPFDFKGVHHTPSATIDLDAFMENGHEFSSIYAAVATQGQIGTYSYEYEMLMSSEIIFSQPGGIADHFFSDNHFDLQRFTQSYYTEMAIKELQSIASRHLGIDDLNANQPFKDALLEAFQYGKGQSSLK